MFVELALVGVLLIFLYLWNQGNNTSRLPPGPRCYPVIGSTVIVRMPEEHKALRDKYGDIVRFRVGQQEMVNLYNYKTIKDLFSKAELSCRPDWEAFHFLADGQPGVIFANGARWTQIRRFLLRHLKDMGMGKSYLSDSIVLEAKALVDDFQNYTNRPTHLPSSISIAVLNVLWQLVASKRYNLDDEELLSFIGRTKGFKECLLFVILPSFFTWLKWLPTPLFRWMFKYDQRDENARLSKALMKEVVKDHKDKLDVENPRDVIDAYLLEIEAQKLDPTTFFNEDALLRDVFDLFVAGFDTTTGVLRWVCVLMAAHPKVQKRIQKDIDDVVGRDVFPTHIHRSRLTYLEATLNEVHRVASFALAGVGHMANCDIHIEGYVIPKGTMFSGISGVIHSDPRYWKDPEIFDPERFLDDSGNVVIPKEGFLPFGVGKRSCLGEALARMELYIFSAALLQNFFFSPPENCEVNLERQEVLGSMLPIEQDFVITPRT